MTSPGNFMVAAAHSSTPVWPIWPLPLKSTGSTTAWPAAVAAISLHIDVQYPPTSNMPPPASALLNSRPSGLNPAWKLNDARMTRTWPIAPPAISSTSLAVCGWQRYM